jgi:phosphatidylglycerophosphate synthase
MIDDPFRRILPRFTGPILSLYRALGATPNQITFAGFGLALGAAAAVAAGLDALALVLWWLGRLLDGTDGIYARASGTVSEFGGFLDILLDMASYGVMIFGFAFRRPDLAGLWLVILFLYMLCITGALALGAIERARGSELGDNRTLRLASGLAEGGETGLAYTAFLLLPAHLAGLATVWALVLVVTVVARTVLAQQILHVGGGQATGAPDAASTAPSPARDDPKEV